VVSGTSSATLTEYALSTGAIGSATSTQNLSLPGFPGDTLIPTGVNVLNNGAAVYVTAYDQSAYNPGGVTTSSANPGWVFGFNVGSGGALTTVAANTPLSSPWKAGVKPSAVTSDLANAYVYVTDFPSNELIGYSIESGSTLNFLINGPFKTGNEPTAITIDPRDEYIYVSNSLDSTVIGYTLTRTTGTPSTLAYNPGSASNQTDTQPVSIAVDPALGRFVFTANHLGNSISGFRLVPDTGVLSTTLATPFPTGDAPTALAIVPHGNHSVQQITP
jgi:6-phosphogluconolactonase (cycloisomerase 2 family)